MRFSRILHRVGIGLLLAAFAGAQEQRVSVEISLFSGRPRPKAEVQDLSQAGAILDSLGTRSNHVVPCSEIPPAGSTPLYTGVLLKFAVPVLGQRTLVVREGYISYDLSKPCYRDPQNNLEKLAVGTAFQYDDVAAPGGPKPMEYLACMVPDSLHPDIAPCATGLATPPLRPRFREGRAASGPADRGITLDGRMTGARRSGFYWSFPVPAEARKP